MRIIRVCSCHDCPYAIIKLNKFPRDIDYICKKTTDNIVEYYDVNTSRTLPDNCPLEEEFTEKEIEEARVFLNKLPDPKPYFKNMKVHK